MDSRVHVWNVQYAPRAWVYFLFLIGVLAIGAIVCESRGTRLVMEELFFSYWAGAVLVGWAISKNLPLSGTLEVGDEYIRLNRGIRRARVLVPNGTVTFGKWKHSVFGWGAIRGTLVYVRDRNRTIAIGVDFVFEDATRYSVDPSERYDAILGAGEDAAQTMESLLAAFGCLEPAGPFRDRARPAAVEAELHVNHMSFARVGAFIAALPVLAALFMLIAYSIGRSEGISLPGCAASIAALACVVWFVIAQTRRRRLRISDGVVSLSRDQTILESDVVTRLELTRGEYSYHYGILPIICMRFSSGRRIRVGSYGQWGWSGSVAPCKNAQYTVSAGEWKALVHALGL